MTRGQQKARRVLEEAQALFLQEYGWKNDGAERWAHPRVDGGKVAYPARDAVAQTYAHPNLGW